MWKWLIALDLPFGMAIVGVGLVALHTFALVVALESCLSKQSWGGSSIPDCRCWNMDYSLAFGNFLQN